MSSYPPALKTVNKAVPCILMCLGFSTLTWMYMHGVMRHSQDHVPKHTYRYFSLYLDRPASKDLWDSETSGTEGTFSPESSPIPTSMAFWTRKYFDFARMIHDTALFE